MDYPFIFLIGLGLGLIWSPISRYRRRRRHQKIVKRERERWRFLLERRQMRRALRQNAEDRL